MNKEEIFSLWAPDESPWSPWAKPVLFAHLDAATMITPPGVTSSDFSWASVPTERSALVLDLPGAEGVLAGLALAAQGYRPVPLYNALPLPPGEPVFDAIRNRMRCAVDVSPILSALAQGAEILATLSLPVEAPPVFLLDANRQGDGQKMHANEFDNRSISFTTDFPSANFFIAHQINRIILVQKNRLEPQPDLAHSLRRWQEGGLLLERKVLDSPAPPRRFEVARPSWYGAMFQRALASLGLHRARKGGFGAWMPDSSATG